MVIYQLWLHPLSKYPGPLLAKFTNLYAAYHGWRQDLHVDMLKCHEKYGPYFHSPSKQPDYGPDVSRAVRPLWPQKAPRELSKRPEG